MKNLMLSDIKNRVIAAKVQYEDKAEEAEEEMEAKIIPLYKKCPEINKLMSNLENVENGEYSIDCDGELIYSIEIPEDIADLPMIEEYLTEDFGHINRGHNEKRLCQTMGGFISINRYSDSRTYHVFDHDSRLVGIVMAYLHC